MVGIIVLFLFWKQPLVVSVLLVALMFAKHVLSPLRQEFVWWIGIVFISAIIEALLVNFAGAWSYALRAPLNVPVYMPLLWGLVGTSLLTIFEHSPQSKK